MRGFTLIEMVVSITLLGIVGLFVGEVVRQSLVLYSDSANREALIQQGRFATERLRREIREAIPNSVVVENNCIEILPITNSAIYMDLPTPSSASASIRVLPVVKSITAGERVVVYPTDASELRKTIDGTGQIAEVRSDVDFTASGATSSMVDVDLTVSTGFTTFSPAERLYFYQEPVAFCLVGNELMRYSGYDLGRASLTPALLGSGVRVAGNLNQVNFLVSEPQLQRNGLVKMELTFSDNGEQIRFDHDALIYNTP
ncbi:type II secretion system GspH family protein [Vibrio sp. Isolate25]|uniref:PilW family protein n=1 Tax=Vibrio TaxID=662 RepID=UPI001EFD60C8|nr:MULTISPECIES: type II secretion system protein [Vibrio]MCG9598768.1 type II secretion system GspH family protein [Vibrio sp. Isolate25]USD32877.1 type II secretion system protein [Vibrio sp. SCSIO 43186]USD45917.1 type II secretion system protein [Vibrio sp. SCSIO 43145]USD70002.1 type II secretion system protein [Vibrio sp. SCSIO 43139]USD94910.1 MSHA biogenesis protein MshO [Vibrio coralliilyticus]